LKAHVHTLGSMVPANTYRNDEYGGMDFSHDSDDSSDRARYHHRSLSAAAAVAEDYEVDYDSHGVKRGGNNHFGSTGILKCLTCRKRKGKVSSPLTELKDGAYCSASIMTSMKRVDFARTDPCNVGRNSLRREPGRMSFRNSCSACRERQGWCRFRMSANFLLLPQNWRRGFLWLRSGKFMRCRNRLLKARLRSPIHDKMVLYCLLFSINPLASTVFFNGQLTDLASVHNQLASARHTPVHKEVHFRAASDHQAQQLSRHPSFSQPQPQATTSRSADNTPSYDMESWFSTFPATTSTTNTVQPAATSSTFTPFHVSLLSELV
jgi:hypothetical protein